MNTEPAPALQHADPSGHCLAITEHSPLPMATMEGASRIVRYGNPAFCRLMGRSLEDIAGKPFDELLPEKDRCVTLIQRVFRTGKPENFTEQDPSKPHPVFWSYTIWPVMAHEGLVGLMIQVTETAKIHGETVALNEGLMLGSIRQHELREAAENLNAQLRAEVSAREQLANELSAKASELAEKARLLDLSYDAIIVRDMDGCIRYWNHGAEALYGWSREEAMGQVSHVLLQTEFVIPVKEMTRELYRTGRWTGELTHTRRDGRRVTVLARKTLDRDEAGHPAAVVENMTDITARKQAEEALRASDERFRALFDLGPVAIFSCDREGVLQNFNRRAAELWGREPVCGDGGEKYCGSLRLYHADGRLLPHGESPLMTTLREGIVIKDAEVFIERPDGSRIAAAVTFSPLKNEKGEVTGAITAFYDITERLEMSDALADRVADLARADRSKDEFLAMLAHELRNPLAPLRNAAEILKLDASAEEREQAQRILGRQIENMSRMIDDLLDVSRITEGKIGLRREAVALETVLSAVTSLARSGCTARRQDLTVSLPAEPVYLSADATRLEQVFSNLLGNASKYGGEGCEISLCAERVPGADPPEVAVRVIDNGAGIAPEVLPRIFDLFVQGSRAPDRAYGGLGIGLTLVQRLVKLHGGTVEARSEGLGRGSEFTVRLPILGVAPALPPPPAPAAPETARRILIVDDNTDSARSLATLMRRRGHDPRTAFTGPAGVTEAAAFLPDVVILDIGLPGMDGLEVARRLRTMPALAGVLIIGMSGYGRAEDRALAIAAGFDEYMVKPLDLDLLRERIRPRTG